MTALRLRIDKYVDGDMSRPPQVYARIYSLDESGAQRTGGQSARQELIPLSNRPQDAKTITLDPGRYYVETVLPSGEILADDVSVASGETQELVLRAEDSPHEWLSWQHLVGNVQAMQPPQERKVTPRTQSRSASRTKAKKSGRSATAGGGRKARNGGLSRAPSVRSKRAKTAGRSPATAPALSQAAETKPVSEVDVNRPIHYLSHPYPPLVVPKYGHQAWKWLASMSSSNPKNLVSLLNEGHPTLWIKATVKDNALAVFRVSWSKSTSSGVRSLNKGINKRSRYFVVVPRRQSVELVSLPIPWNVVMAGREADIEVAVQEPNEPSGFCTAATARDEQFGMLLGYLSSGSLPSARQMAETAEGMLFQKFDNPYAAAAGAYALVGTALRPDQEWHAWVKNLMLSFPHIPDGAIQWGQLKLRMRRNATDIEDAKNAFKLAYRRGLPFYSMGMRWLLDGLESVSRDDTEAGEMLKNVRRLAWRTHYQQPFTIIRLGGETSV